MKMNNLLGNRWEAIQNLSINVNFQLRSVEEYLLLANLVRILNRMLEKLM